VWRQGRSVSVHCNRKTERSGCVMGRECWVVSSGRGLAPAPPGFSALVPVPMRGLYPHVIKKGCSGIPPRSVEATESALRVASQQGPILRSVRADYNRRQVQDATFVVVKLNARSSAYLGASTCMIRESKYSRRKYWYRRLYPPPPLATLICACRVAQERPVRRSIGQR
jgi:hypothetical protein